METNKQMAATEVDVDKIFTYITNYVKKHYNSFQEADQEDMIQATTEKVLRELSAYDPSRGAFDKFLAFHIKTGASQAYGTQLRNMGASSYVHKKARMVQADLDNGLSVDEIVKKRGMRKNTILNYMNLTAGTISLDTDDYNGNPMHERIGSNKTEDIEGSIDLSGLSEMDQFIVKTYLKNLSRKDWKKKTLEECSKWGISKKKAMEAVKKIRI